MSEHADDPLIRLKTVKELMDRSKLHYDFWLKECVKDGFSNVRIARELGLTEAAIRMYRKRNGL